MQFAKKCYSYIQNFLFITKIKEKILNSEELLNHYLVRGFMEMLVFRMSKQFPNEIKKTRNAKEDIVLSKVKI